jgi:hypothetical protein
MPTTSSTAANTQYTELLTPQQAAIPDLNLAALTSGTVDGSGTFDGLMTSVKAHLQEEFIAGRITGGEYTKAYIALVQVAMTNATQFLLSRDQAYWSAAKSKADFALTKLKLATEEVGFSSAAYNLATILPAQAALLTEQKEVQRAQTMDTRSDGVTPVAGSVKSQKDLYAQQIVSYQRSSEVNAAKIFIDSWVADSALQDSPIVPAAFTATNISAVLTSIKTNNNL